MLSCAGRAWHSRILSASAAQFLAEQQLLYLASRSVLVWNFRLCFWPGQVNRINIMRVRQVRIPNIHMALKHQYRVLKAQPRQRRVFLIALTLVKQRLVHVMTWIHLSQTCIFDIFEVWTWRIQCSNKDGRLWASVIAGPRGFLQNPSSTTLKAEPCFRLPSDPAELDTNEFLGTTAITLETRQRHRLNGRVRNFGENQLVMDVEQSFGGCPKYIQGKLSLSLHTPLALADSSFSKSCGLDLLHTLCQPWLAILYSRDTWSIFIKLFLIRIS